MCVMDVRPDMPLTDMAQAMTHNVSTVERDALMMGTVCEARGERALVQIEAARSHLATAHDILLGVFGDAIAESLARDEVIVRYSEQGIRLGNEPGEPNEYDRVTREDMPNEFDEYDAWEHDCGPNADQPCRPRLGDAPGPFAPVSALSESNRAGHDFGDAPCPACGEVGGRHCHLDTF